MIMKILGIALDIFLLLICIGIITSILKFVFGIIKFLWKINVIQLAAILEFWKYIKCNSYIVLAIMITIYIIVRLSWDKIKDFAIDHVPFIERAYEKHNLYLFKKYNVKIPEELKECYEKKCYNV